MYSPELIALQKKLAMTKLRFTSANKRMEFLNNNIPDHPVVSAWCSDLTEDLSGNIGTIEILGERDIVQIQPGYDDNAVFDSIRDGQLQPAVAGTPASVFYNLAMLPGWQKWKPTYRHGTISNIDTDADTCDVQLYADKSSQQGLAVNQESKLSGIPIEYMDCNSVAFEDGDSVLVKFEGQEWGGAKVVGFKDNPKACFFYIDLTVNGFTPAYFKTVKLVDAAGMVHIADSSFEEPSKAGPFLDVVFPAKVYLYLWGNAPWRENDTKMLFSYFTENPVKEFTVVVETWVKGSTIDIDGIKLGNGDQQKFSWDFTSKTWSTISGGISQKTTKFMAYKVNPASTGFNQATKKEVVNAYEGTRILLTHGDGEPQTMGEIYDYCFSATKVHSSFYNGDTYRPYYGPPEFLPVYGPPFLSVVEELYYLDAWRVSYLLADDEGTIEEKPIEPMNFTASRLGSLKTITTLCPNITPGECGSCNWSEGEEKTWEGNKDDIVYNCMFDEYLMVALRRIYLGFEYWDTPNRNPVTETGCTAGTTACSANSKRQYRGGGTPVTQMGILTDSDGHNLVFPNPTPLEIDYEGSAYCWLNIPPYGSICKNAGVKLPAAEVHEFRAVPTEEHRI